MSLALLSNVSTRVVALLGANPGSYASSVSGNIGAFPSDAEITTAALEADEWVATKGYFQSVNDKLSAAFIVQSASLTSGAALPFAHGTVKDVEISQNGTTWNQNVIEAAHIDDIVGASVTETYVEAGAFDRLWKIDKGRIYTSAPFIRVKHPQYTRSAALQCDKNEESLIVFRTVATLAKNASPALFTYYDKQAEDGLQRLIGDSAASMQARAASK